MQKYKTKMLKKRVGSCINDKTKRNIFKLFLVSSDTSELGTRWQRGYMFFNKEFKLDNFVHKTPNAKAFWLQFDSQKLFSKLLYQLTYPSWSFFLLLCEKLKPGIFKQERKKTLRMSITKYKVPRISKWKYPGPGPNVGRF